MGLETEDHQASIHFYAILAILKKDSSERSPFECLGIGLDMNSGT